tara:strand:- start:5431 stop:5856 length:426 start_codon:yes stop_codon:yes gene_type:complete
MRSLKTKNTLLRLSLNKDFGQNRSYDGLSISLNNNKLRKGNTMKVDNNKPVDNAPVSEKPKDTRTPISLDKAQPVIASMGKDEFDKHFRITGINALSVYIKQNPDSAIARCYNELGKTNQVHFKIGDEDWVIRINGARVKK